MAVIIGKGSFKGFGGDNTASVASNRLSDAENSATRVDPDLPLDVQISNNLQRISDNVKKLKNMIDRIGTAMDSKELRGNVRKVQDETNKHTKQTSEAVKAFSQLGETEENDNEKYELKIKERRFRELFHDVLKEYNALQKDVRIKMRDSIRSSLMKSGYMDIEIKDDGSIMKDGQEIQLEQMQAEVDLDLIKEREAALKQLEEDIRDINSIFKDLAGMVQEQGEMITEAETNVEEAVVDVAEGTTQLEIAVEHKTKSRKKQIAAVVIVAIILVVLVTVIVLVTKKSV